MIALPFAVAAYACIFRSVDVSALCWSCTSCCASSTLRTCPDSGRPMKIAHVVDSMEVGGAETLVAQMCRLQREQGHDPCVYAIAKLGALGEQLRQGGLHC